MAWTRELKQEPGGKNWATKAETHNVGQQAVVRIGLGHEQLDRGQQRAEADRGLPRAARLRLEEVEADTPRRVNVGVVDGCHKPDHWRFKRIPLWDGDLQPKQPAGVRRV